MHFGKSEGQHYTLRVQIVGENEAQRALVRATLGDVADPPLEMTESSLHAGVDSGGDPDVALVLFGGNDASSFGYLQAQAQRPKRPILFALLHERSPMLIRSVLHGGADEILFLPLAISDATRALLKFSEHRRKTERSGGGTVFSVTSLCGGAGVTTLSGNLALALRYALDKRTALVDLNLQNGGLGFFLQVDPEQTILPLIEFTRKLDSIKLETALTKHSSGVYLLAAPKQIEDSELVTDLSVGAVLDLMRQLFDYVVVDCGRHVDENALAAWERSDEVLYVIDQSIVAARTVPRFMELFSSAGLRNAEMRLVLNKYESQGLITEADIVRNANCAVYAQVPGDRRLLERAQLRRQDLWKTAPNSALARSFERLAKRLSAARDGAAEENNGFFARMLNVFGAQT